MYENYSKELGRWYQVWAFSPKIGQFAVIVNEITERKNIEEELRLYSLVLRNSSEGMIVTDEDNLIIAVNPAFTNITGYSFEEVRDKNPNMFKSGSFIRRCGTKSPLPANGRARYGINAKTARSMPNGSPSIRFVIMME